MKPFRLGAGKSVLDGLLVPVNLLKKRHIET